MKLENKVKNAMRKYIARGAEYREDDGYHKIVVTEPEFGHIIIDIQEHRMGVKNDKKVE